MPGTSPGGAGWTARDTLSRLAERGEPRGADALIARLEARLEDRPVIGADTPGSRARERPPRISSRRRRKLPLVLAVAVAVVVIGVAVLRPLLNEEPPPVAAGPEFPPGDPTVGSVWFRVPHDESVFGGTGGQRMNAVVAGGPGLVAVGVDHRGGGSGRSVAAVWTSPDGVEWSRAPHDESVFGGPGVRAMNAVVAGGPGLVAVGSYSSRGDAGAAVWTSVDGLVWSRVPGDDVVSGGPGGQGMNAVVAGGPGLVAVGSHEGAAAVWTSVDGWLWLRVPHDESVLGGPGRRQMTAVVAGGPGLVAVGSDHPGGDFGPSAAAVWTSVDGVVWSRVAHDGSVFGDSGWQAMSAVVAGDRGLVAVGHDGGAAAVWTSPDAVVWSRVAHDEEVFGGPGSPSMISVTAGGPGLVAVGHGSSDEITAAAVWTSVDGLAWSRVPSDEAILGGHQVMVSVVAGGPGLVAVGADSSGRDEDAAVWVSPPPAGPRYEEDEAVRAAGPRLAWSRVPHDEAVFGGPGGQAMRAVTLGGPGLVAVGHDSDDRTYWSAAAWTSVDGWVWSRVPHDEEVFGGPGGQSMSAVVAGGPGLVAVGHDGGAAAVWTSVDGVAWSRVPHDEAVFGGPDWLEMRAVTAGGPGLVAVGSDRGAAAVAAVWTSVDGSVWSRVPHDEEVFGGPEGWQEMFSVAVGGPGLVAVGHGGGGVAAVWTSVDGVVWSRVPHDEEVFGAWGDWQAMSAVVAGGPGLVAVGSDGGSNGPPKPVVWTSVDALVWSRVPHDQAVFGGEVEMTSVVSVGRGLVAVGSHYSGWDSVAAVWVSPRPGLLPDGGERVPPAPADPGSAPPSGPDFRLVWNPVPHDEEVFGGPDDWLEMRAVTAGGPGLVAVGSDRGAAAVWTSVDGVVWSRVAHDESVFGDSGWQAMSAVVAGDRGLVAVGHDGGAAAVWTSPDGVVWSRVPHDEAVFGADSVIASVVAGGPGLVAVGSRGAVAAVWTSPDGVVWSRVPHDEEAFGRLGRRRMNAVAAGGPGLVAVGYESSGGPAVAAVSTSVDGVAWSRVAHDAAVFDGVMTSVAAGGPGLVAVGTRWSGWEWVPAVWASVDGVVWSRMPHDEALSSGRITSLVAGGPGLVAVGGDLGGLVVWVSRSPN